MSTATMPSAAPAPAGLGTLAAVRAVFSLEMKQRLRSRGWYILLAVWFVVIGVVSALTALNSATDGPQGPVLYELIVGFVLFFGLLLAPALSANAINGDRSAGTLAILQVTLLRPGQILAGKWLASWVASLGFLVASVPFLIWGLALGGVRPLSAVVAVVMLAVELGVVCAIGVGVSTLANRPLFSIVVTYMLVALLSLGTLIGFGLSLTLVQGTVKASSIDYRDELTADEAFWVCTGDVVEVPAVHTERVAWLLAANPFVIVADAIPHSESDSSEAGYQPTGVMQGISSLVRMAQAGPEYSQPCVEGQPQTVEPATFPIWPLGLVIQLAVAGLLLALARRRLVTPVRRLAAGTRIA
ncbi:ABC transporter permease [Arthrobacter jiangjiafuii]|uniref:ABC transporter permease n=1 Tax=Arthrobacter jiangjiafuii TaxID=2817475 RepID=A0A975M5D9_9MICC|nr:ABC transporter permease subunit [Arthrobacter jiangjiafuii]MBP3041934.1 ABC transporter permease subunit [Arthrobacter jiangjiafuii]QWC10270.1 ABC transporter permease [Arthrobacter jiangjiafuii]